MVCFDFLRQPARQPAPCLSEVPEDKDMSMGTCFGNAESRFCSDIAYLFISEEEKELREAEEIIKRKKSLIFTHCL